MQQTPSPCLNLALVKPTDTNHLSIVWRGIEVYSVSLWGEGLFHSGIKETVLLTVAIHCWMLVVMLMANQSTLMIISVIKSCLLPKHWSMWNSVMVRCLLAPVAMMSTWTQVHQITWRPAQTPMLSKSVKCFMAINCQRLRNCVFFLPSSLPKPCEPLAGYILLLQKCVHLAREHSWIIATVFCCHHHHRICSAPLQCGHGHRCITSSRKLKWINNKKTISLQSYNTLRTEMSLVCVWKM